MTTYAGVAVKARSTGLLLVLSGGGRGLCTHVMEGVGVGKSGAAAAPRWPYINAHLARKSGAVAAYAGVIEAAPLAVILLVLSEGVWEWARAVQLQHHVGRASMRTSQVPKNPVQ